VSVLVAVAVTCAAVSLGLYLHEWGHGIGYLLGGHATCVGFNITTVAPPRADLIDVGGLLGGPLVSLMLGGALLVGHLNWHRGKLVTFAAGIASIIPHFLMPTVIVVAVGLFGAVPSLGDEGTLALMLPEWETTETVIDQQKVDIERAFLVSRGALVGFWPLTLAAWALVLAFIRRGAPARGRLNTALKISVPLAAVIWAFVHAGVAAELGEICVG